MARQRRREEAQQQEHSLRGIARKPKYPGSRKEAARVLVNQIKAGTPCMDCGGVFHLDAMEFDHRDPSLKVGSLRDLKRCGVGAVMKEIAKCDLVCANCHRARTARRRQGLLGVLPPPEYLI